MGKRKNRRVQDDLEMYTGMIRLYEGDPKKDKPIEDMMIERFPATSMSNAQQCLINFAQNWLDENGIESGGCRILFCHLDDEVPANVPGSQQVTALHAVERGDRNPVRQARKEGAKPAYVPYKCPVVAACSARYIGSYDDSSEFIHIKKEVSSP